MLNDIERRVLVPIFDQILSTVDFYNNQFPGFEVYITGSSLNLIQHSYNDIDLMVVVPEVELKKIKLKMLSDIKEMFKSRDLESIQNLFNDPKTNLFGMGEVLNSVLDSLHYLSDIATRNEEALMRRLESSSEMTRLLVDPEREITTIQFRLEGLLESEKANVPLESDGTHGFQFGILVEAFLKSVASNLTRPGPDGQAQFYLKWYKSFTEGYGKVAGENNCHIYPRIQCTPVHLFLTNGVDNKKAMEKKDSFMLEYYSAHERMLPIKLYGAAPI